MSKSSNYRIRVEPELHQEFLDVCKADDRPAAQVIREFMKNYVLNHRQGLQAELFVAEEPERYNSRRKQNG
ncbi:MAG TPA: plasmid-related protein [Gammaproteobacteria bacterium]|nr:plasmid-related protein [Gammaproteobacteria bacterium]